MNDNIILIEYIRNFRGFKLIRMASTQDREGQVTIPLQYNDAVSMMINIKGNILVNILSYNFSIHFVAALEGNF